VAPLTRSESSESSDESSVHGTNNGRRYADMQICTDALASVPRRPGSLGSHRRRRSQPVAHRGPLCVRRRSSTKFRVRRRCKVKSVVFSPSGDQRHLVSEWLAGHEVGVVATSALGPHEGSRGGIFELEVETTADASRLEEIQDKLQRFLNGKDDSIMVERLPTDDSGSVGSLDGGVTSAMDRPRDKGDGDSQPKGKWVINAGIPSATRERGSPKTGRARERERHRRELHSSHGALEVRSRLSETSDAYVKTGKKSISASAMKRWLEEEEERRAEIRRRVETGEGSILKRGKKKMEAMKAAAASAARSQKRSHTISTTYALFSEEPAPSAMYGSGT